MKLKRYKNIPKSILNCTAGQTKGKKKYKTTEHSLQKAVSKYLCLKGWLVVRANSSAFIDGNRLIRSYIIENNGKSAGLSDLVAMKGGEEPLLIEIKSKKGRLTESQEAFKKLCNKINLTYIILNDLKQLEALNL